MNFGTDAQNLRIGTTAKAQPRSGVQVDRNNNRQSTFSTAPAPTRRFSPYDATSNSADVAAGGGPYGRQSGLRPTVTSASLQIPVTGPKFAQVEMYWNGLRQQPFGGTPDQALQQMGRIIGPSDNLQLTRLGGNRDAQPEMTSEVPGENGFSTYANFGNGLPPRSFPKYQGAPGALPPNWGVPMQPQPSALATDMPSNTAIGAGSDGFFQFTRDGVAYGSTINPFASIDWGAKARNRVLDLVEQGVNMPMVHALLAVASMTGWDERQEGQVMFQVVESLGELMMAAKKKGRAVNLSPHLLPHTLLNVPSVNYFLAAEKYAGFMMGWTIYDVLSKLWPHGLIRGDSSARMGEKERFGLSTRVLNFNTFGGEEDCFNEWPGANLGWKVYFLVVRVPLSSIKAGPNAPDGTYCLTAQSNELLPVPDDTVRRPWQVVPWVGKSREAKPTKKDVTFINNDGFEEKGAAFEVGIMMQKDFVFESKSNNYTKHTSFSAFHRAQLPMCRIMYTGRRVEL